jgi:hypothetical protein
MRQCKRFFHEYVAARFERYGNVLAVHLARRVHRDHVTLGFPQCFAVIGEQRQLRHQFGSCFAALG